MRIQKRFISLFNSLDIRWFIVIVFAALSVQQSVAQSWQVESADQAEVVILDEVVRTDHPGQLFGFNINFRQFQEQLWSEDQAPKMGIVDALKPFEGALYRYPGGSVANAFHWEEAIGDVESRAKQSSFYQKTPAQVRFGIDEYFDFVSAVGGKPWYVLNLVGTEITSPFKQADVEDVTESLASLATYLLANIDESYLPLSLQLGNELDRSRYEWTAEEYGQRAKAVISRLQEDGLASNFEFVNFMRDFTWRYRRDDRPTSSTGKEYLSGVIDNIGLVNDYSLHHYYDGNRTDGNSRAIPFWLKFLSRSISDHKEITGEAARIWITEHGRQPKSREPGNDGSVMSTSNLAAGISTADYLISLTQFAEIKGAVWHALNAGPWQLFDYSVRHKDLRPRPVYWALRVLRMISLDEGLKTITASPNKSGYAGGYDVRGAAFRDSDGQQLGLRLVNRATETQTVKIKYDPFAGKDVSYRHFYLGLADNLDPEAEHDDYLLDIDPTSTDNQVDEDGYIFFDLPASSVSSLLIQAK